MNRSSFSSFSKSLSEFTQRRGITSTSGVQVKKYIN
jgi:hypothetical protein